MCGILGIIKWERGSSVTESELSKLNDTIYHRGPDDGGVFTDGRVGLAMRRLSIIDISSGHQPITSPDGDFVIVFNGEIYNYREIKLALTALGHAFRTNSDTEVILHGYKQWGADVFSRMNGMWGFAIYDKKKGEVFLSRDRLGKKQIYYAANDGYFVFGSEMKIPMMYAPENRKIRLSALPEFLAYGYIGGPATAMENVKLLPAGSWVKVSLDGKMSEGQFWNPIRLLSGSSLVKSENDAAEMSYELLKDAVKIRLVSDVPLSVMLSSGLDSSSCAYILAKELKAPLKTFTLGYSDVDFDESEDAGELARKLDMPWERSIIAGADVAGAFPQFISHCDSLQANTAQLVYYFTCKMIHGAGFKVAVNGSGGDELFAGYKTYQANTIFSYYRRLPSFSKTALRSLARMLPPTLGRVSFDYMIKKFTECPYDDPLKAHSYWRTMFSPEEMAELFNPEVMRLSPSFTRIYDEAFGEIGSLSGSINGVLLADLKAWLIPMLPWVDNISMAHSVELRLPFLDYRLVELALSMPEKFLFSGWKLKKIMRRFLEKRLPPETLRRPKRGTHLPVSRWLNGELKDLVGYHLSSERLNKDGLFNMGYVRRILDEHQRLRADNTFKIWNLVVFSAWAERNRATV